VPVTHKEGGTLQFSRRKRDHKFWDWYFDRPIPLQFTDDGLIQVTFEELTLYLKPGSTDFRVFREIFLFDCYSIRSPVRQFDTVIDLGGNIGLFTCAALQNAQRIIAVEPARENYKRSLRNITANGGNPDDVILAAATAKSGQKIQIHHDSKNADSHSISPVWVEGQNGSNSFEWVETISLEGLFGNRGISKVDLLKCDIEGAEYELFLAASDDVLSRITEIVMEAHISPEHPPQLLRTLLARLKNIGFSIDMRRDIPNSNQYDNLILTARKS